MVAVEYLTQITGIHLKVSGKKCQKAGTKVPTLTE